MTQFSNSQFLSQLYHAFSRVAKKNANDIKVLQQGRDLEGHLLDKKFLVAKMITLQNSTEIAIKAFEEISLLTDLCRSLNKINWQLTETVREFQEQKIAEEIQAQKALDKFSIVTEQLKKIKKDNEQILATIMEKIGESSKITNHPSAQNPKKLDLKVYNEDNYLMEEEKLEIHSQNCITTTDRSSPHSEGHLPQDSLQTNIPPLSFGKKIKAKGIYSFSYAFMNGIKLIHNYLSNEIVTKRIKLHR